MSKKISVGDRVAFSKSYDFYAGNSYFRGFRCGKVLNVQDDKVVVWVAQMPEIYDQEEVLKAMDEYAEYQKEGTINGEKP